MNAASYGLEHWFEGQSVFVTGAGSGIGRAASLLFAARGAKVVAADISESEAAETARLIHSAGGQAIAVSGDVSQEIDVTRMIEAAAEWSGGLSIGFNNAGIVHPLDSTWDVDAFRRVHEVNLMGVMLCMKAEIALMRQAGGGVIVNTASAAGIVASGNPAVPAYVSSKHAVVGLTKTAALQYAKDGIRVNAVCPGVVDTNMLRNIRTGKVVTDEKPASYPPIGRLAQPEEIAEAVIWLASSKASYVTGSAMLVDGGHTAQ